MDGSLVNCGPAGAISEVGFTGSADDEEVEEEEAALEEPVLENAVFSLLFSGSEEGDWLGLAKVMDVPAAGGESCSLESTLSGMAC